MLVELMQKIKIICVVYIIFDLSFIIRKMFEILLTLTDLPHDFRHSDFWCIEVLINLIGLSEIYIRCQKSFTMFRNWAL